MGYSPWSCKESDTTEQLTHTHVCQILHGTYLCLKNVFNLKFEFNEASDVLLHSSRSWGGGLPWWLSGKESAC